MVSSDNTEPVAFYNYSFISSIITIVVIGDGGCGGLKENAPPREWHY